MTIKWSVPKSPTETRTAILADQDKIGEPHRTLEIIETAPGRYQFAIFDGKDDLTVYDQDATMVRRAAQRILDLIPPAQ